MAKDEDRQAPKKPLFSPRFMRVYFAVCILIVAGYFTIAILNSTGVIRIPPEKDNFGGIFGPLWMWTDDPVLRGILMVVFFAIFLFLLPGLLVVGVYLAIAVLVVSVGGGIIGALIAIYYLTIVLPLWSMSPTGKVLAVILGVGVPAFVIRAVVRAYGEQCVTWFTELAVKIFFFIKWKPRAVAVVESGTGPLESTGGTLTMPDIKAEEERLREQMLSLTNMNPSLPAVPTVSTGYRGWIQEVKKRIELRSVHRTREEELKLIQQINVFWEEILRHKKTITALERIDIEKARAAKLEPVQDEATIAEAELRATKARDEREQILAAAERRKIPPSPSPRRLTKDEKIVQIEKETADKIKQHEGNLNVQDMLRRIGEDKKMRVMEEPD